jgi:hypothetical protein
LSDDITRKKYNAGLALEASFKKASDTSGWRDVVVSGYRAPLTCGFILAVGIESLGRFIVSEIKQWEDIQDESGQVMVTSWPAGSDQFVTNWV